MDTPHLRLALENWSLKCSRDRFCFHCSSFFCNHCCPWHWKYHHPELGRLHLPRFATFGSIYWYPAVLYKFPLTLPAGYIWQDIERMPHPHSLDAGIWILLKPRLRFQSDHIPGPSCLNCHRRIWMAGALYCCANCKLARVHQGEGRDLMLTFVQADYNQALPRDRFCCLCFASFSSAFCAQHTTLHHPYNVAGYPGLIVEIVHINGWATVAPSLLVPGHVLAGVQFGLIDGYPAVLYEFPLTFLAGSIWQDIERFRLPHPHSHDGANWILLKPMLTLPSDPITGQSCLNCHRRIWMAGALYCCANCKLAQVHQGEGRDLMLAFVQADYDQALPRDRFCCLCFKSFSSAFCAQHTTLHHPYNVAGYPGQIVEIVHINGWAAVAPSMLVPGHVLAGVQALNAGGAILYPLAKTAAAAASLSKLPPGAPLLGRPSGGPATGSLSLPKIRSSHPSTTHRDLIYHHRDDSCELSASPPRQSVPRLG
ncbi:hypothetical protein ABZP36_013184 [Zizania latifolia]